MKTIPLKSLGTAALLSYFLFLPLQTLWAQTVQASGASDSLLQFSFNQNVIPEILNNTAEGATLNAIKSMPLSMTHPDKLALGFQVNYGGGPLNRITVGNQSVPKDPNIAVNGNLLAFPTRGAAVGSSFYAITSGSVIGLRRNYVLGVHAAYHNLKRSEESSTDPLRVAENLTANQGKGKLSMRSRALGFRLGIPIYEPRGWSSLRWSGVQVATGLTYSHQISHVHFRQDRSQYAALTKIDNGTFQTSLTSSDLVGFANFYKIMEYRTRVSSESRNFVLPLEIRTGFKLGFVEINLGPGLALNHGSTKVDSRTDISICSPAFRGDCSQRYFLPFLANLVGNSSLATTLESFSDATDPDPFYILGNKKTSSRAFIPYFSMDVRVDIYDTLHLIVQGVVKDQNFGSSVAIELRI